MTFFKPFVIIPTFLIIAPLFLGYSFMSAQVWTSPLATPPANNTRAPINVGISATTLQNGAGSLVFNRFAATDAVWSNSYCDSLGGNCFSPATGPAIPNPACVNRSSAIGSNSVTISCLAGEVAMSGGCLDTCSGVRTGDCTAKAINYSVPTTNGWSCTVNNRAQATVRCCTF